jgi:NADPH:quinone reductase-like Zn-dependent oxidoreductase
VRLGYLAGWFNHQLPLTIGWDVSGVIEALGPGVTGFEVGDEVFSRADVGRDGGYAEYMAVNTAHLAPKPTSIDHLHTAAIPNAALAAWQCLINVANLSSGQTVLIHGAAGGVGHFAVQFARWRGARVIGTSSEQNLDFVRSLGADEAIDYNATRFEEVVSNADVVLDTIGGEVQQRCWGVLRPGGMLASIVEAPSEELAAAYQVRQAFASAVMDARVLREIASLVDQGVVKPVISTVLPLREASQAHQLSQSMHTRGKIVLDVAGVSARQALMNETGEAAPVA